VLNLTAFIVPEKTALQRGINLLLDRQLENGDWAQENIDGDLRTFTLLFYVVLFLVLY
jgi:hypothetical protein